MSTFVFAMLAGVVAGCAVLSVALMAADLWLRWQRWREEHPKKEKTPRDQ